MTFVTLAEFKRIKALGRLRKVKRVAKAKELWKARPGASSRVSDVFKKKQPSLYKFWLAICIELAKSHAKMRDRKLYGRCRICMSGPIECGYHIIPVGKLATAFDVDNIVGACHACNNGEHWHRLEYRDKHREIFGAKVYEALWAKSNLAVKFSVWDLRQEAAKIRDLIKGIR